MATHMMFITPEKAENLFSAESIRDWTDIRYAVWLAMETSKQEMHAKALSKKEQNNKTHSSDDLNNV